MKKILLIIFLIGSTFNVMAQFTAQEKEIIHNGTDKDAFRVLLTTNEKDSIILRTKCEDIDSIIGNKDLALLIQRLFVTMSVEQGVGIAAPQVGISKNIFLFVRTDYDDFRVEVAINPKIINHPDETICFERDGCLSIPDASGNTIRYPWIEVEYTNLKGEKIREKIEGYSRKGNFASVIFQHEYDHLQGILFIDKICPQNENE